MPVDYIEINGIEETVENITDLFAEIRQQAPPVLEASLSNLRDHFEYPPASEANRPKHGSWGPYYNRGVGPAYRRKRDGETTQYFKSERLGANWTQQVISKSSEIVGVLGNKASYGPDVHDPTEQADFHARRGWKTTEDALKTEHDGIIRLFERLVQKVLERF